MSKRALILFCVLVYALSWSIQYGVIAAYGGRYGGFAVYVKDGHLVYENNSFTDLHEKLVSSQPLPSGKVQVTTVFTADPQAAAGTSPVPSGDVRPGKV